MIRYKAGSTKGVVSGYSSPDVPADISVPGCGLEDVDRALFDLFDKQLKLTVHDSKTGAVKKAPVIFASGERYAMFQRNKPIRDNNESIILPLITMRRTGLEQGISDDITGRGINQQTGELVIKRRLSPRDRSYQNLVNKLGLPNQADVAGSAVTGSLDTFRKTKAHELDTIVIEGGLMNPILDSNVWEILTIPSPQFFKATYEITFWTQYTIHMNQMIQQMMAAYLMQGATSLRVETTQGYWFVANVESNQYRPEDNSEEFGDEERLIRYTFNIIVPAYFIPGSNTFGVQATTRRYISAPTVQFDMGTSDDAELPTSGIPDSAPSSLDIADDPTDDAFLLSSDPKHRLFAPPGGTRESSYSSKVVFNPFTKKKQVSYAKVVTTNPSTGETVYREVDGLSIKIVEE